MRYFIILFASFIFCTAPALSQAQEKSPDEETPKEIQRISKLWYGLVKPAETDLTSRKIIELNLKARGGREALEKVKTIRVTYTADMARGTVTSEVVSVSAYPESHYIESETFFRGRSGKDFIGYNGEVMWGRQLTLDGKLTLPKKIGGLDRYIGEMDACISFLLINPDSNGHIFQYTGEEKFANRRAYVLHCWLRNGMELDILFDTDSFHILTYRIPYTIASEIVLAEMTPTSMKKIDGTWWDADGRIQYQGSTTAEFRVKKIELNPEVDSSIFEMPKVKEFWLRSKKGT